MRYIENLELREWVKESLRKTIFQKAHALAVQTGCEILVKLKDASSAHDCPLYYASESLQQAYRKDGVREEAGEMFVAGETGLAVFPMVDSATQSSSEENAIQSRTSETGVLIDTLNENVDAVSDAAVPMQLSLASEDVEPKQEILTEDFTTEAAQNSQGNSLTDVVVKLERMEDEELNERLGAGNLLEQTSDEQTAFQFDNSVSFDTGQEDTDSSIGAQPYPIMSPKPYQCGVCGKAFRSVQVLQKHTQTFHMRPQLAGARSRGRGRGLYHARPVAHRQLQASQARYLCVMCNRSFRSPDLLQDHMTRSHMSHPTPVQLSTSQGSFDPSSAQTSQAPSTATLQSLQHQTPVTTFQSPTDASAQFQMSQTQSTPGAFNVSAASSNSSTFASPTSSPMFRYRQPGLSSRPSTSAAVGTPQAQSTPSPSRSSGKGKGKHFYHSNLVTSRSIMSAILLMSGPACTRVTMNSNGPKVLRHISRAQFMSSSLKLEQANLGSLVDIKTQQHARSTLVFIKKPPNQVQQGLQYNNDLCTIGEYTLRYNMRPPASIVRKWRQRLVGLGLIPDEHFKT